MELRLVVASVTTKVSSLRDIFAVASIRFADISSLQDFMVLSIIKSTFVP